MKRNKTNSEFVQPDFWKIAEWNNWLQSKYFLQSNTLHEPYRGPCSVFDWTDVFLRKGFLVNMCAMTHPYLRHDSFIWLCCKRDLTSDQPNKSPPPSSIQGGDCSYECHDSLPGLCVPWPPHMCAMTHSYGLKETQIKETQMKETQNLIEPTNECHSTTYGEDSEPMNDARRDSLRCVPWLTPACAVTHWYDSSSRRINSTAIHKESRLICVYHDPLICVWHEPLICVPRPPHMCAMSETHSYGSKEA